MSHDLVLQTKIGREETLEKFLHTIGKKGTIKDPCAVRLRRVNREEFEAEEFQAFCYRYGFHFPEFGNTG